MPINNSKKDKVTIVLPTLNEEKAITSVIDELKNEGYTNYLVVDGHSSDNTTKIAESMGAKVVVQEGKGKTDAIKESIKHLNTKYSLFMDCDLTYDPKDIENLLDIIDDYDQVIGTRKLNKENNPRLNRFGNKRLTGLFNLVLSTNLTDVLSGMYMFKTEFLKEIEIKSEGFQLEIELAARSSEIGKIGEVPINYRARLGDTKVSPLNEGWKDMKQILKFSYHYNPTIILSFLSGLIMIPGLILTIYVGITWIFGEWHGGILQIGIVLLIVGANAVAFTFLSIIIRRIERKVNRTLRKLEKSDSG